MNNKLDLVLSVKKSKFRIDDPTSEHSDKEYLSLKPEILERDDHTCQCCNFKSLKWQEIHHRDNDHTNNDRENLVTVCPLCHIVFHIGFAGYKQLGRLIFIDPSVGITQAELNNLVRALWVFEHQAPSAIDSSASGMLDRIKNYSIVANMLLSSSDPAILAEHMMTRMSPDDYENRGEIFKGFFMFPNKEAFSKQIKYWSDNEFGQSKSWRNIAMSNLKKWSENDFGRSDAGAIKELWDNQ